MKILTEQRGPKSLVIWSTRMMLVLELGQLAGGGRGWIINAVLWALPSAALTSFLMFLTEHLHTCSLSFPDVLIISPSHPPVSTPLPKTCWALLKVQGVGGAIFLRVKSSVPDYMSFALVFSEIAFFQPYLDFLITSNFHLYFSMSVFPKMKINSVCSCKAFDWCWPCFAPKISSSLRHQICRHKGIQWVLPVPWNKSHPAAKCCGII